MLLTIGIVIGAVLILIGVAGPKLYHVLVDVPDYPVHEVGPVQFSNNNDRPITMREHYEITIESLTMQLRQAKLKEERASLLVLHGSYVIHDVLVTGYAPFDNQSGLNHDGDPTKTSTGTYPNWGTVAVDPRVIPYGTLMYIPGYGLGIASDTGGAVRSYDGIAIDLYFDTHEQAITWGRQTLSVTILGQDKEKGFGWFENVKEDAHEKSN